VRTSRSRFSGLAVAAQRAWKILIKRLLAKQECPVLVKVVHARSSRGWVNSAEAVRRPVKSVTLHWAGVKSRDFGSVRPVRGRTVFVPPSRGLACISGG
jgi:hypothetical protein